MKPITKELVDEIHKALDKGLTKGLGNPVEGEMTIVEYELEKVIRERDSFREIVASLEKDKETLDVIARNIKAGAVTLMWVEDFIKRRAAIANEKGNK